MTSRSSSDFETNNRSEENVAADIARVLLDPDNSYLLDNLYEGSSFTPVIGGLVGIELQGDTVETQRELDPVRDALKLLRRNGALEFERLDVPTVEKADGTEAERTMDVSVIRVVTHEEKLRDLVE